VLIADEPTGNLDSAAGAAVFALFRRLADSGTTILVATHERALAFVDRAMELVDGSLSPAAVAAPAGEA